METEGAELRQDNRERPVADLRSLKRKFREKKKQKRDGRHVTLEIQDAVHGARTRRN